MSAKTWRGPVLICAGGPGFRYKHIGKKGHRIGQLLLEARYDFDQFFNSLRLSDPLTYILKLETIQPLQLYCLPNLPQSEVLSEMLLSFFSHTSSVLPCLFVKNYINCFPIVSLAKCHLFVVCT